MCIYKPAYTCMYIHVYIPMHIRTLNLKNVTHNYTDTHRHTCIYIYIYIYVCVCVYSRCLKLKDTKILLCFGEMRCRWGL